MWVVRIMRLPQSPLTAPRNIGSANTLMALVLPQVLATAQVCRFFPMSLARVAAVIAAGDGHHEPRHLRRPGGGYGAKRESDWNHTV